MIDVTPAEQPSSSASQEHRIPFPRFTAVALLLVVSSGCKETSSSFIRSNRDEITTLVGRVRAVEKELPSIPTTTTPFSGVDYHDAVLIPAEDFPTLETASGSHVRAPDILTPGHPPLAQALRFLPEALRDPSARSSAADLAVLKRSLDEMRQSRYAAVIVSPRWTPAQKAQGKLQGGAWSGRVALWNFEKKSWHGVIPVQVRDVGHYAQTGAYWTGGGRPDRSIDTTAEQASGGLSLQLWNAVTAAITKGAPYEAEYEHGKPLREVVPGAKASR